jgi:Fe-S-cluster containining protein
LNKKNLPLALVFIFMDQSSDQILKLVNKYNVLMNEAIIGPNCVDPHICHADCCHIMIDVPKILAEYYIEHNYAKKEDFVRGDLFSFKIAINTSDSKCIFYDKALNGCSIHHTLHKPPQCWIYPTGFSPEPGEEKIFAEDGTIKCKIAAGWKIIDIERAALAKLLFDKYVKFCENEFVKETSKEKIKQRLKSVFAEMGNCAPKSIAGIVDGWTNFSILKAEGISLKLKKLCNEIPNEICNCDYLDCKKVCDRVIEKLHHTLLDQITKYIESNGPKNSYSFLELWNKA